MGKFELEGKKFGRLTAIMVQFNRDIRKSVYLCRCQCGCQIEALPGDLMRGHIRSCGCLERDVHSPDSRKDGAPTPAEIISAGSPLTSQYINGCGEENPNLSIVKVAEARSRSSSLTDQESISGIRPIMTTFAGVAMK